MAAIISNGILYAGGGGGSGNANVEYVTQEEYDALPDTKLTDNVLYFITDGVSEGLPEVVGDLLTIVETNGTYSLTSGTAVYTVRSSDKPDETGYYKLVGLVGVELKTGTDMVLKGWQQTNFEFRIQNNTSNTEDRTIQFSWLMVRKDILALVKGGGKLVQNASEIPFDNTVSGLVATNVQSAIDEVSGKTLDKILVLRSISYTGTLSNATLVFAEISNIPNGTYIMLSQGYCSLGTSYCEEMGAWIDDINTFNIVSNGTHRLSFVPGTGSEVVYKRYQLIIIKIA